MEEPNIFFRDVMINEMARTIYKGMGYTVEEGYDFYTAKHPTERMCWSVAEKNYDYMLEELYKINEEEE